MISTEPLSKATDHNSCYTWIILTKSNYAPVMLHPAHTLGLFVYYYDHNNYTTYTVSWQNTIAVATELFICMYTSTMWWVACSIELYLEQINTNTMSLSFNTGLDVAKWSHDRYPQSCIYYSYSYLHDNFNLSLCTIGKPLKETSWRRQEVNSWLKGMKLAKLMIPKPKLLCHFIIPWNGSYYLMLDIIMYCCMCV